MNDKDLSPDVRAWLVALVQANAWPWAILAQILDEKGIMPTAELRTRFEHGLHAMKAGLSTPGIKDGMRPDFILMQSLIDALKNMEANGASQTRN